MRAQRLEPVLAFWVDLLRQLGLLGTVLGIGLSLMYTGSDLTKLLGPLALKVWTTVAGLACSILLSASFAMKLTAWVDAAEKNLEAWDASAVGAAKPRTSESRRERARVAAAQRAAGSDVAVRRAVHRDLRRADPRGRRAASRRAQPRRHQPPPPPPVKLEPPRCSTRALAELDEQLATRPTIDRARLGSRHAHRARGRRQA